MDHIHCGCAYLINSVCFYIEFFEIKSHSHGLTNQKCYFLKIDRVRKRVRERQKLHLKFERKPTSAFVDENDDRK